MCLSAGPKRTPDNRTWVVQSLRGSYGHTSDISAAIRLRYSDVVPDLDGRHTPSARCHRSSMDCLRPRLLSHCRSDRTGTAHTLPSELIPRLAYSPVQKPTVSGEQAWCAVACRVGCNAQLRSPGMNFTRSAKPASDRTSFDQITTHRCLASMHTRVCSRSAVVSPFERAVPLRTIEDDRSQAGLQVPSLLRVWQVGGENGKLMSSRNMQLRLRHLGPRSCTLPIAAYRRRSEFPRV